MSAPAPRPAFDLRILDWHAAREGARAVREAVFIVEQHVPRELEWDEWDEPSVHALACDETGRAIGTARLLPDGHLGRMAVLAAWRRQGVGMALANALIARASERGDAEIVLHAQTHAVGFYRKLGFTPRGPQFDEAGIPHVEMARRLLSR